MNLVKPIVTPSQKVTAVRFWSVYEVRAWALSIRGNSMFTGSFIRVGCTGRALRFIIQNQEKFLKLITISPNSGVEIDMLGILVEDLMNLEKTLDRWQAEQHKFAEEHVGIHLAGTNCFGCHVSDISSATITNI